MILHLIMKHFALISKRREVAVPLLIPIILFWTTKHSILISIIKKKKSNGSTTSHSDLSLPNYESFCFDINHQEEKSSGSTTSKSDHSLPDYEEFCFEEKSSGNTTSHSDPSFLEYESFYFDLSIDPLPPADRSDSHLEELADELAHIISLPEYDRFYFDIEPDPGELTRRLEEIISDDSTKELTSPELNDLRLLLFDCDFIFSKIGFSEIDLLVSFPSGNEEKVFNPEILLNNGIFSFTRKSPHLLIDNFMIDNCHILSEISLKIVFSICFHPKGQRNSGRVKLETHTKTSASREATHVSYLLVVIII
ncbi:hypothetical protein Tco_0971020 [Tanacetum coccineum]